MPDWKLHLYHHLTPALRNVAANVRGYQLYRWRYGSDTEQLVAEALDRDHWSPAQWKAYQETRLSDILHRAATQVPYYRTQWEARRRAGDRASWEYLENWPILEKEPLRQNPYAFVADDCNPKSMFHEHTSGTTGKSLDLWWSKQMVRAWFALFEARWRRWNGVSLRDRWAILGGQLVTPIQQQNPPFWIWNQAFRQLYLSSYHLSTRNIRHYVKALSDYDIQYLYCYTSSAYAVAVEIEQQGLTAPRLKVVLTNAEPLYSYQREVISRVFNCPVRETYGMAEVVAAASECQHSHLHLWPEIGIVEVCANGIPAAAGKEGELVCTGLANRDMPLIRYRVGDSGILSPRSACECGRVLPQLEKISGRNDDVLFAPDGRRIGRLDPVFKTALPIVEAQIVQEALDRIKVRYVPAANFTQEAELSIARRLRDRLGETNILFEQVQEIPRESNGKFRAVICNLSPDERKRVQKA